MNAYLIYGKSNSINNECINKVIDIEESSFNKDKLKKHQIFKNSYSYGST